MKSSPLILIAFIYILTAKGHLEISDTEYSVRTAFSIIENGNLLIEPPDPAATVNFPATSAGDKIYSPYGIGLSFIFIPVVIVAKFISYSLNVEQRIIADFLLSFYNIPFALLGLSFFKRIIVRLGASEKRAVVLTIALAIGTCFWKYSVTDFSEISQTCCLLGTIYYMVAKGEKKWTHISFWYALLVLIKLTHLIFLPLLFIYFVKENRSLKSKSIVTNLLLSSAFVLPALIIIASLNYYRFNNPFESGYGDIINFGFKFLRRDWFGYLISTERGILSFNPLFVTAFLGLFFLPRERRTELSILGIIALVWYLTMCFWSSWQGGYCWGNRLLVPIIPILLLPLTFAPYNQFSSKLVFMILLSVSIFIQFTGSFTKIHEIIEVKLRIQEITNEPASSQLYSGINLFLHKIQTPKAEYLSSDFGTLKSESINLTRYKTFHGFNIWSVHLMNHLGLRSFSHWVGIIVLTTTIFMCIGLFLMQTNYMRK